MSDNAPTILIVDDEKQTSRTMAMALEAVGYHTIESASADEGLAKGAEVQPQLIVLDYHMEDKDGVSMLSELRKTEWGKTVPVIVASNVYDVDIINDIMGLGVQDYVLKADINLDGIVKLVGTYVPLAPTVTSE
jgi:two-component system KDP operon response regulator KdpE